MAITAAQMKLAMQDAKFNVFMQEMRDRDNQRVEDIREIRSTLQNMQSNIQNMQHNMQNMQNSNSNLNIVTIIGIAAIVIAVLLK